MYPGDWSTVFPIVSGNRESDKETSNCKLGPRPHSIYIVEAALRYLLKTVYDRQTCGTLRQDPLLHDKTPSRARNYRDRGALKSMH